MIQRLGAILLFYKPFFLGSMVVNILIVISNPSIFTGILVKFLLTVFVWYLMQETGANRKLIFYKNLGISTRGLFTMLFLIDISITIIFLLLIKAFL